MPTSSEKLITTVDQHTGTHYVASDCADMLAHVYEDGEQTTELDPYVRVVGPAYTEVQS